MLRRFLLLTTSLIVWMLPRPNRSFLVFTENTVLQATVGVSMPVEMNERGGASFNYGFQFNYVLPWNFSQLEMTVITARKNREVHLQDLYTSLEHALDEQGWQSGRECFLRTICELAATPLDKSDLDVLAQMIYLLFTPSEDLSDSSQLNNRTDDNLYLNAEKLGKRGGDCMHTYPDCVDSPLDLFTQITSS